MIPAGVLTAGLAVGCALVAPVEAGQLQQHRSIRLATVTAPEKALASSRGSQIRFNSDAIEFLKDLTAPVNVESFPLNAHQSVDLQLERFRITGPNTRFVIGRGGAGVADLPLTFDHESIVLLRGRVPGECDSRVYLAIASSCTQGFIRCSKGMYAIGQPHDDANPPLSPWDATITPATHAGPAAAFCQLLEPSLPTADRDRQLQSGASSDTRSTDGDPATTHRGLRQIELAIETDHQFFQVFGDLNAAATYIVQLYGAVSDVFMHDINVRIDLTYVRLWDSPTVPFASSLSAFRTYWNGNMQAVHRDVAQMFSGRGDLPGGVAYLSSLCNSFAYSFCGNVIGHFGGVDQSSVYNYDLLVAAHELGHNFGSQHTDAYGLDICNTFNTPPQRGSLMSYCSQTVSGGNAVMDMRFHKVTQQAMRNYIATGPSPTCAVFDCNGNNLSDQVDITSGASADANANGIPDECEDCNSNGVLDSVDIGFGASFDVNSNGIPDECEPDCNNNQRPDDVDIQIGASADLHGNNIPDECETDCDSNGQSDYNQIMTDMTLDRNRNIILDSCEDCDNDGIDDLTELNGAWDVWLASSALNRIAQYHAVTGVWMRSSAAGSGGLSQPWDVVITIDQRVLVTSPGNHRVVEFDAAGNYVRDLVPSNSAGVSHPAGMVISPAGTLLVASMTNHRVLEFDRASGAYLGDFIAAGSGGLTQPMAMAFGPDGHLYVSSATNQIFRYNGSSGAFLGVFVTAAGNGGLNSPRGMVFKPDGHLLVTSFANDSVLEYDGATGAFLRDWAIVGVAFDGPWGIRIAPNGHVHVSANLIESAGQRSHLTQAYINEFNVHTGNWVRGYVMGVDANMTGPTGFDYLPGLSGDCNQNQVPDNCDISSGASADINSNGIPDECEDLCPGDITGDQVVNVNDLLAVINAWGAGPGNPADITGDGIVNVNDLLAVINAWGPCAP